MKGKNTKGLEAYIEINYLKPDKAKFYRINGSIILEYNDKKYDRVDFYRTFPLSIVNKYISVREHDGDEIGLIFDLNDYSKDIVKIIKSELDRRYFTPKIYNINKMTEEYGYHYWNVKTEAGYKDFITKVGDNSIRIKNNQVIISDIDGNRFKISNIKNIEDKYLKIIESLV